MLTDEEHAAFDPEHSQRCEDDEINGGRMDRFVTSTICGDRRNFAIASQELAGPYWDLAGRSALADRYFQPETGSSSANDMYFARAAHVFIDNDWVPRSIGSRCTIAPGRTMEYHDRTIADLLGERAVPWAFYIEGYQAMIEAQAEGRCPAPPDECAFSLPIYPCVYDASDIPFQYYPAFRDDPSHMRDLERLRQDIADRALPPVSFVKAIGYKTEHPGLGIRMSPGVAFATALVEEILSSRYGVSTLVLVVYDEGGGYFDHVSPPANNPIDGQPYGTRVPLIAAGPFVRHGHVSHVPLEHSSVVKFIEWNWLGKTGLLGTREVLANNLGSLLDADATGGTVPW